MRRRSGFTNHQASVVRSHNSRHKIVRDRIIPERKNSGRNPLLREIQEHGASKLTERCGRRWSVMRVIRIIVAPRSGCSRPFVHGIGQDTVLPLRRTTTVTTTKTTMTTTTTTTTYDGGKSSLLFRVRVLDGGGTETDSGLRLARNAKSFSVGGRWWRASQTACV